MSQEVFLGGEVIAIEFSPDGQRLAVGSNHGVFSLLEVPTAKVQQTTEQEGEISAVAFSPDSTLAALGGTDQIVRVVDSTGIVELVGHFGAITSLAFTTDGRKLVSGSTDHTVRIWNLQTREAQVLTGFAGAVTEVAVSPSGDLLAAIGEDELVRLWPTTIPDDLEQMQALLVELTLISNDEKLGLVAPWSDIKLAIGQTAQ